MKFLSIFVALAVFVSFSEANWKVSYKLKFYYPSGSTNYNQNNAPSLLTNPKFKPSNPTVLYLYGQTQTSDTKTVKQIRDAYVNANYNFILFDVAVTDYTYDSIEAISAQIAKNLVSLFNAGLNLEKFEITGFSIGAQYAGYVSRAVNTSTKGEIKLPKLFALEPAVYSPIKLDAGDATFVMTVHTENVYSDFTILGDVAFYPNGGLMQPMCQKTFYITTYNDPICSHLQVQEFWAEAVAQSGTSFPAIPCDDDIDYNNKQCNSNTPVGYMNPKVSTTLTGKYYLATNENSPFAKSSALA